MKKLLITKKRLSIKIQFIFLAFVLVLSIILIMFYSFFSYYNLQSKMIKESHFSNSSQVMHTLSSTLENITKVSLSLAYNQSIHDYLNETDKTQKFKLYQDIMPLLNTTKTLHSSIIDIAIIGLNGDAINIEGDITVPSNLLSTLPMDDNIYFFGKTDYYLHHMTKPCLVSGTWIHTLDNSGLSTPLGAVLIAIDPLSLFDIYSSELNSLEMIFLDRDQNLIAGNESLYDTYMTTDFIPNQNTFYTDTDKYFFNSYEVTEIDGLLVTFIPNSIFLNEIESIMVKQVLMISSVFLIVGILVTLLFKQIFHSINQLLDIMNSVNKGNYKALKKERINTTPHYICQEAYTLSKSFNNMLDEINRLNHDMFTTCSRMYELELANKRTELAFLRSQINPHFLYNTLALICGMSTEGYSEGIVTITHALSQIFRYSIKGHDIVPFKEELAIIKSYVMIQTMRFEGRFCVEYVIDEDTLDIPIPKMVLQPLVENAIVHGLEPSLDKGHLILSAKLEPTTNCLILEISDTGVGMSLDKLKQIRDLLTVSSTLTNTTYTTKQDNSHPNPTTNIGLLNVNSRVKLHYGEDYPLEIDSQPSVGTNIKITIPYLNSI